MTGGAARITGDRAEQDERDRARYERDPEDGPEAAPERQQRDRERRPAEARRDEERQDRKDHLVVEVGEEIGHADADDVAVEPAGGFQMISSGSGRNGPPSLSATKALASTGVPLATDTMT